MPTFSDIPEDHPYYDAIEWAAANGISIGYPDGTYRSDRALSRGEMAVFLQRFDAAAGLPPDPDPPPDPEPPLPPSDGDVSISPGQNIQSEVNANSEGTVFLLTSGVHGNQTFDPKPNQQFHGEPGTVLDGGGATQYAVKAGRNAPGVVLRGFEVVGYDSGRSNGALAIGAGGGWVIEDMDVHHNLSVGLVFNGPATQVLNCHFHHNGALGVKGFGKDSLVEGCEIDNNNPDNNTTSGWEGGGTKFLYTVNLTLRDNWVHHNGDNGLWADYENTGTVYEDNLVEDNRGIGIFHEISYSAIIRNNVVRNNAKYGIKIVSSSDVEVDGNTVTASGSTTSLYAVDSNRGTGNQGVFEVRNLYVHHNTITMDTGFTGLRDNKGTGKVWANNNRFDYNTYLTAAAKPFFWSGNTRHTWAEWQAFGQDANGTLAGV